MSSERVHKCAFCGKDFIPNRADAKYCSSICGKKSWTLKRAKKRAKNRRSGTRLCAFCGKEFQWDSLHANARFCSPECKRHNASSIRARNRLRTTDIPDIPDVMPQELDGLRQQKSEQYFKTLLSLPIASQIAEMRQWSELDHVEMQKYIGLDLSGDYAPPESEDGLALINQIPILGGPNEL